MVSIWVGVVRGQFVLRQGGKAYWDESKQHCTSVIHLETPSKLKMAHGLNDL